MENTFRTGENYALKLDDEDHLKTFRSRFYIPDENTIYMDGNSLGRLPLKTKKLISDITEKQWGTNLIESWNTNWYNKSVELGDKIAQLIGASKGEVIVSDSTSLNLYKLAKAALKLQKGRNRIVSDVYNFPTDLYILQGILKEFGPEYELVLAGKENEVSISAEDLAKTITNKTALVVLSMVTFKNSFLYNAVEITKLAHDKGALVLWDLSHAAGAVPVELNSTNADLAVGCTYKFLNGGPGSPAFLYVKKDLQNKLEPVIQGWFGDNRPFAFDLNYEPAKGIRKFLVGTPPIISQVAMEPGLDLLLEAKMENIRKKSVQQSEYFIFLTQTKLSKYNFQIGSPPEAEKRGSHVSIQHPEAYRICQAMIYHENSPLKVIPDFRDPNFIRFGITPLYTSYNEIWQTISRIEHIMRKEEYQFYSSERKTVT